MNKSFLTLSLIAVAGLAHADLKSELKAADAKLQKASMAKDIKGAEAVMKETMTPDFKYVQDGKTQDLKTFIKNFTDSIAMMEKVTAHSTKIISLKENGKTGSGKLVKKMTGIATMPDKKSHKIDWIGEFTEEYRKVGGHWKTARMTAGKQDFLMDGKPVKM